MSEYAKVLVFARNKVGKTRFAATAPNCLIIDINEVGTRSARGYGAHKLEVSKWEEVVESYWWLRANRKEFESVAIDTTTAMEALARRFVLKQPEAGQPQSRAPRLKIQDHGAVASLMRPQLLAFRNLPMHVVFTAQERREYDEDSGELTLITADLAAGSRGAALGAVGVVGHLSKVRPTSRAARKKTWPRRMLVGDHDIIDTGNRLEGALPRVLRDPSMPDIIAAYRK